MTPPVLKPSRQRPDGSLSGPDKAGIGQGQPRKGHAAQIVRIAHRIGSLHKAAGGGTHTVQAYSTTAHAVHPLQMGRMLDEGQQVKAPGAEAEQKSPCLHQAPLPGKTV